MQPIWWTADPFNWSGDPNIWFSDPFIKAIHASRREKKLQPDPHGGAGGRHRAWGGRVNARYRPPGRRRVGHAASSFPDARGIVRSAAVYESGCADAEGCRTRSLEFFRRSTCVLGARLG